MGNTRQRLTNTGQHTRREFRQLQETQQGKNDAGKRKTQVVDERGVPYVTEEATSNASPFIPSAWTAFKVRSNS